MTKGKMSLGVRMIVLVLLVAAMSIAAFAFTACGGSDEPGDKTVKSITVATMPTKTEYVVGETFTAEGGELEVTYTDGTTETVPMTAEGVKHLYDDGISFITRCPTNRDIYKQALAAGLADLEQPENLAVDESGRLFNGRQVYVKCVPIDLDGMKLYAYVGRDKSMQEQERRRVISKEARSKKPLNKQALHEKMEEHGVFVLVSSRRIRADKLLCLYYVRQDIEQVFDVSKNYASLLPLNVEKQETFRGHLLMTFIATVLLQMLQNEIRQSPCSLDRIFTCMQTQKAKVYENVVIPSEPTKGHNEIYKLLKIKPRKEHTVPVDCWP